MAEKMKKSSMKQAPKGRMPAIRVHTAGCMYHTYKLQKDIKLGQRNVLVETKQYLGGHLAWDLVGPYRMLIWLFPAEEYIYIVYIVYIVYI